MTDGGQGIFSGRLSNVVVTSPDVELRHYISDTDLDLICASRSGPSKDIFLVCLGAFLGSITPAVDQISRFNASQNPMGIVGLATSGVAIATLAGTIVAGLLWKKQAGQQEGLVERIRNRPRFNVPE